MTESVQLSTNRTDNMDDDPEKRSITAPETDREEIDEPVENVVPVHERQITREKMLTTLIICFCNLINFMDRYSLPGKHFFLLKPHFFEKLCCFIDW